MKLKSLKICDLFRFTEKNPTYFGNPVTFMVTEHGTNGVSYVPINKNGFITGGGYITYDGSEDVNKLGSAWDKWPKRYVHWYNWSEDYKSHFAKKDKNLSKDGQVYTYENWERDGTLKVKRGQFIDNKTYYQLRNAIMPIQDGRIFQVGEAHGHDPKTYESTYYTFVLKDHNGTALYQFVGDKTFMWKPSKK